jgi:hypothetical protein
MLGTTREFGVWFEDIRTTKNIIVFNVPKFVFANMLCSAMQSVFIAAYCVRKKSDINCWRKYRGRVPSVSIPCILPTHLQVNTFRKGTFLQKNLQ